jgi:hypothetical protein
MKLLTVLSNKDRLTDLSMIGVPEAYQQQIPSITSYPRKFDSVALPVWQKYVSDPEFKAWARAQDDLDIVWHETIKNFLKLCETEGVLPFANNTDLTRNEFLQDAFNKSRIMLVQWLDEVGLFERVKVRKASREYIRSDKGMIIRCWADLFPVKNLPEFEDWLKKTPQPRFQKYPDNRWSKLVQPHIMIWVKMLNASRTIVGYEIRLAGTVNIPGKKTPSKKDVDKFIDNTIWYPIVRAHRIAAIKNRLF